MAENLICIHWTDIPMSHAQSSPEAHKVLWDPYRTAILGFTRGVVTIAATWPEVLVPSISAAHAY